MAGRPTRSGGLVLAGMADSSQPADRPATRLFDRLSAGFARPLAMVRRVLSEPEERCDVSSRRSSGRMPPAHATAAEGRLGDSQTLTRKIPAVADSFATLRGFVPRGPIARRHLTPVESLQPLSRSVIGARSAAPIAQFELARARTLPARSILSGTAGNLQDRAIVPGATSDERHRRPDVATRRFCDVSGR